MKIKDYLLGIILIVQWLVFWAIHFGLSYAVEQAGGDSGAAFWLIWLRDSFENLTSEAFQAGQLIVLGAYFYYKGSSQSKDGEEEILKKLDELSDEVRALKPHREEVV